MATGLSRETVTGADGRYTFTSLRPTTYDITVELSGFRPAQRKGVLLQANQNLTVNFAVELGTLAETVTVSGESPLVDVSSATLSEVVDSKRIVELPLNGRDAATLSTLVPGMVLTTVDRESGKTIPGALRMSTNGTESRQVSFRLDGTSHSDPYYQQNQPFPFPDALQEFSIQTSNYSAAQGNSAGAVVNAVTRSGTNELAWRRVRLPARSRVHREELLRDRQGLPEAQAVRRLCRRTDSPQQDVLLRRLAGHDDRQPRHATSCSLRRRPTSATATSPPAARPAIAPSPIR